MDGMGNLMTMLAKTMPEEELLNDLRDAITKYLVDKNEKNTSSLEFNLIMASTSILTKGKDTMQVLEEMEKTKKGMDLLNTPLQ